jgi:transcriptional regulator with XRE-family HTH domain
MASMSVMVYSRLGDLLRVRNLTVSDLQRQIAARFGLTVDTRMLERLARAERVRRPDLEVAAAAAAVLDVSLNDVFAVEAVPVDDEDAPGASNAEDDILDPNQSQRLQALFDVRERRPLTPDEQAEMRALVAEYGHRVHERGVRELAERRNLAVEQVRAEVAADFERALAWWDEVQADPARLEALVNEARERQQAHADG